MSRIPRQQIGTLAVPDLSTPPPVSGKASLAVQMARTLGVIGDTAVDAGQLAAQVVRERRRKDEKLAVDAEQLAAQVARERQREDEKLAELEKGRARIDASTDFQKDQPLIAARNPLSHDELPISQLLNQDFAPRLEKHSAAYQRQYLETAKAAYSGAVAEQVQKQKNEDVAFATSKLAANVQDAHTVADVQTQLGEYLALDPKHTKEDFYNKVVTPALHTAAQTGNAPATEIFTEAMVKAGVGEGDIEIAWANLQTAKHKEQGDKIDAFKADIGTSRLAGESFDALRAKARSYQRADSGIPADTIVSTIEHIDAQEREAVGGARADALRAELRQYEAAFDAEADSAVHAGQGFTLEDRTVTLSNGEEKKLQSEDAMKKAMDRAFAQIASSEPNQKIAFAKMADLASSNGYQPPQWKRTLAAGYIAATETALAPEGKDTPIPPATAAGFDIAKRLKSQAPGLYETMVNDEKMRDLYESAMYFQEDASDPNDQTALLSARRIMSGPGLGPLGDIKNRQLANAASHITDRLFRADAKNGGEIAAEIDRRARVFIRAGLSPDDAVYRVAKQIGDSRIIINKWAVPTGDAALPDAVRARMPEFAADIIKAWADKHGKDEGIDASDLTLRPSPTTRFWMLADGRTGFPVRNFGDSSEMMFAPSDLIRMAQEKDKAANQKIIDRQNKAQDGVNNADGTFQDFPGAGITALPWMEGLRP